MSCVHGQHQLSSWTLHWANKTNTTYSQAIREPWFVWSVQRASEEEQLLSCAMPTGKWFLMQTLIVWKTGQDVCVRKCFTCPVITCMCVPRDKPFPVSLPGWPKIISILCVTWLNYSHPHFAELPNLDPTGLLRVLPGLNPTLISSGPFSKQCLPGNNSRQNRVVCLLHDDVHFLRSNWEFELADFLKFRHCLGRTWYHVAFQISLGNTATI